MAGPLDFFSPDQLILPQAQQGKPRLTPLNPEEEQGLLSRIGDKALGGLGYVGSVLEKTFGGRALRGALGGNARELLSILPGSDTLGITDERDRVSGKELLGLKDDDGWLSTLGGIGAELALDPSTYLSFGGSALSKGGQVAKKIGVLPKTVGQRATGTLSNLLSASPTLQGAAESAAGGAGQLAGLLHQPLGGVAGLGLPFAHPSVLLGTGQAGANFMQGLGAVGSGLNTAARVVPGVGGLLDKAGTAVDATGRYLNSWFDPTVMGAVTRQGQEVARDASSKIAPLVAESKGRVAQYAQELAAAGQGGPGAELRAAGEGVLHGPAHPVVADVASRMRGDYESELAALQGLGVDVGPLRDDFAAFMSRQKSPLASPTAGYGGRPGQPLVARDPRIEAREDVLKNFPGGTEGVNRLVLDPDVYAGSPMQAADVIRRKHLNDPNAVEQSTHLADWVRSLDPQYRASIGTQNEMRFFGNHPLQDYGTYFERTAKLRGAADASHSLLASTAIDLSQPGAQAPAGSRRVLDVLKDAGLDFQVVNSPSGPLGGTAELAKRLGLTNPAQLGNYVVPGEVAGDLTRYAKGFSQPESLNPLLKAYDYLTNLTKTFQTALWPSFHVRNLVGGQFQNLVKGGFEPGHDPVTGFLKPIMDAKRLIGGEVLPDANRIASLAHLSPEQATQQLAQEMYAFGVSGHAHNAVKEATGGGLVTGSTLEDVLSHIPGQQPKTIGGGLSRLGTAQPGNWNPLNTESFAPAAAGREIGDMVEGVNRGSLYLALRRQGYVPEEAARQVLQAHFDYSRGSMTDVEANVLKRLIPFYKYTRENIPFQVQQLMQRPGGLVGMEAKAAGDLRQQGGFLPDYLGSGLAMPLGKEDDGTQRYLTRLDLPPEQAFEMLKGGPSGVKNTMMAALSNLNPMLKAPLEYATGKQFFTGRDLEDLYTMTGNTAGDQAIMNSPLGRAMTTVRTLADERKWQDPLAIPLNLGTGLKVTDVDMAKQRNIAAREYLTEMLRGQPDVSKFTTLYPTPGATLTPQEELLLRLNMTLEQRAQQAARQKKVLIGG